jgi:hypothetical protein
VKRIEKMNSQAIGEEARFALNKFSGTPFSDLA